MKHAWYGLYFSLAVFGLGCGGLFAFRRLENEAQAAQAATARLTNPREMAAAHKPFVPIARDSDDYAQFAAEDAAWRRQHARQYTLSELRARGDGTRSPREKLDDRVYAHMRAGKKAAAITELERWVAAHPTDQRALLNLARLLNETGRDAEAVTRYRQLLRLKQRNSR